MRLGQVLGGWSRASRRSTASSRSWRAGVASARTRVTARRAGAVARPGPPRWDRLLIRRGLEALWRGRGAGKPLGPLRSAGRRRGLPRTSAAARGHRLGPHRGALRGAGADLAVTGRRADRAVAVGFSEGGRGGLAIADRVAGAGRLAPIRICARGAGRPACPRWAAHRGSRGLRRGGRPHAQRAGAALFASRAGGRAPRVTTVRGRTSLSRATPTSTHIPRTGRCRGLVAHFDVG